MSGRNNHRWTWARWRRSVWISCCSNHSTVCADVWLMCVIVSSRTVCAHSKLMDTVCLCTPCACVYVSRRGAGSLGFKQQKCISRCIEFSLGLTCFSSDGKDSNSFYGAVLKVTDQNLTNQMKVFKYKYIYRHTCTYAYMLKTKVCLERLVLL